MDRLPQSRVVSRRPWGWRVLVMLGTLALAGGFTSPTKKVTVYQNESFESDETYSRLFDASPAADTIAGLVMKQLGRLPRRGDALHIVEIEFRVTCAPEISGPSKTLVFVSALQDRYALKKTSNSASLGVSALGSVSIPLSSNDDSLVKVASETIPAGQFYDRFFTLMQRNLDEQVKED